MNGMSRKIRRGLAAALLVILGCAAGFGRAEAGEAYALPLEGSAPYPPVSGALSEDGLSYDDGTVKVRIEEDPSTRPGSTGYRFPSRIPPSCGRRWPEAKDPRRMPSRCRSPGTQMPCWR